MESGCICFLKKLKKGGEDEKDIFVSYIADGNKHGFKCSKENRTSRES